MCQGSSGFQSFLHHFVLIKLATSSIHSLSVGQVIGLSCLHQERRHDLTTLTYLIKLIDIYKMFEGGCIYKDYS